jgi:hypothetical protein
MIWESGPWKEEVARRAYSLERRKKQKRWRDISAARLEQDVFYAAFAVRKLVESFKLSDEIEALSIQIIEYPANDRVADIMNWDRIDELYDLSRPIKRSIGLLQFCNQIIHSFIFLPCFEENLVTLSGFFFSSDRMKIERVLYLEIDTVIALLYSVAQDDIVTLELKRESIGMPMRVTKKSCKLGRTK